MRNNLTDIRKYLNLLDTDPRMCQNFLDDPRLVLADMGKISALTQPTDHVIHKMDIIFGMIRGTVLEYDKPRDQFELEDRVKKIYIFLDGRYDKYLWQLHDVHYHTNFGQFVNCTFTTASEISEVIERILGEYFHA